MLKINKNKFRCKKKNIKKRECWLNIIFLFLLSPVIFACEIISGANNSISPPIIRNAPINAANTNELS